MVRGVRFGFVAVLFSFLACSCGGAGGAPPANVDAHVSIGSSATGDFLLKMSTSFQPAEWDDSFFSRNPGAAQTLGNLLPQHVRLQAVSQGIPQRGDASWDFGVVDAVTQVVLGVSDHSPEFQIASGPPFLYDSAGSFADPGFRGMAAYAQHLVQYYNGGGFTDSFGQGHRSPSPYPITWWGIYNEPNLNNHLTPQQYVALYNAVVPAMQAVDPSLRFVALELSDFSNEPEVWAPPFVSGVTARVDALATHFYSSCNQRDTDAQLMASVPVFAGDVRYLYSQLRTNPVLASVPVWVTENNVQADFADENGFSVCNAGQAFVTDPRGSSAFFAGWRPYVFSQLGKAGAQALYHWDFDADAQFGEVDFQSGRTKLSYWVDYWLARTFPSAGKVLDVTNTDDAEIEVLAVRNSDGTVVVLLANHAVAQGIDNNGTGVVRSVGLDLSALQGSYTEASLVMIDSQTSPDTGPTASSLSPGSSLVVTLHGYSVGLVTLR